MRVLFMLLPYLQHCLQGEDSVGAALIVEASSLFLKSFVAYYRVDPESGDGDEDLIGSL